MQMIKTLSVRVMILNIIVVILALTPAASAQEPEIGAPAATEPSSGKEYKPPEAEFVGSPSFRSASLVQGLWSDSNFEGHYFGGHENNVGYTAGSWPFHGEGW